MSKAETKLKPCPFCASTDLVSISEPGMMDVIQCKNCRSESYANKWDVRPLENKLKKALDIFFKDVPLCLDENYTHRMRTRRLQQSLDDVRKLLGIAKTK